MHGRSPNTKLLSNFHHFAVQLVTNSISLRREALDARRWRRQREHDVIVWHRQELAVEIFCIATKDA